MKVPNGFSKKGFTLIEVLTVILLIAILASIAISHMMHTREQAYVRTVEADLLSAYKAAQSYFSDNPTGQVTPPILDANGYRPSKGVSLTIVDGNAGTLIMTASHSSVAAVYQINNRGRISKL